MYSKRIPSLVAALVAATVLTSACGAGDSAPESPGGAPAASPTLEGSGVFELVSGTAQSNRSEPGTGDWAFANGGPVTEAKREVSQRWAAVVGVTERESNPVVNGAGLTLYRFDDDDAGVRSNCSGPCAEVWPPVTVKLRKNGKPKVFKAGVSDRLLGSVKREDGSNHLTIGGWPVYRFAKDTEFGDTKGQGRDGKWFAVTPTGGRVGQPAKEDEGEVIGSTPDPGTPDGKPATRVTFFSDPFFAESGFAQGLSADDPSESQCVDVTAPGIGQHSSLTTNGVLRMWNKSGCKGELQVAPEDVENLAVEEFNFDNEVASVRLGG